MMQVRVWCSQTRTREPTFCLRSLRNMDNAYTALCSIRQIRMYCTSRTIVEFTRVSTRVMIGSIYNTTCLQNLAFQSHSMLTIPILCTLSLRTRMDVIMSTISLRSIEVRMAAM